MAKIGHPQESEVPNIFLNRKWMDRFEAGKLSYEKNEVTEIIGNFFFKKRWLKGKFMKRFWCTGYLISKQDFFQQLVRLFLIVIWIILYSFLLTLKFFSRISCICLVFVNSRCVGFSWAASPACTELETLMLDWMGKMIELPKDFLFSESGGRGGGVIQVRSSLVIEP